MQIPQNPIKKAIKEGRVTYGFWNCIINGYAAEIAAGAGFDWVLIDAEHGPFELGDILTNAQAMAAHDCGVMVRVQSGDPVLIKRLLDIGIQSLMVPMVETATQAQEMVEAIRYPPAGKRGLGAGLARAAQWGRVENYLHTSDDQMCLIVQVETMMGINNLEAICQVDGVDGVFIGPSDLAASMGHLGGPTKEEVRAVIRDAIATIKAHQKSAGVLALDDDRVQEYRSVGADCIGIGADLLLLEAATSELAGRYRCK